MAISKFIIQQKQSDGTMLDMYPRTSADAVLIGTAEYSWSNLKNVVDAMWPIYAAWTADGENDTLVNKIQEILSVFENYPEGDKVLDALNDKLSLSGGTMTGNLDMGAKQITNVNTITSTNVNATDITATNVGTSVSPITNIYASNIGTSNKRITKGYFSSADILSLAASSISADGIYMNAVLPQGYSGAEASIMYSGTSWNYCKEGVNPDDTNELVTKNDISNFASKVTPKEFDNTSISTSSAYTAVKINNSGLVTWVGTFLEIGSSTTAAASSNLATGGVFFKMLA